MPEPVSSPSLPHAVQIVEDARYKGHTAPAGHPERPERLVAIGEAIDLYRGPGGDRHSPLGDP